MGRKSREKRERRTSPAASIREGEVVSGISVRRRGEQVVLTKKMTEAQHSEVVDRLRGQVVNAPAELAELRDQLIALIEQVNTAELLVRMCDRFMLQNA